MDEYLTKIITLLSLVHEENKVICTALLRLHNVDDKSVEKCIGEMDKIYDRIMSDDE